MAKQDKAAHLYWELLGNGATGLGTITKFQDNMANSEKAGRLYDQLKDEGWEEMPEKEKFVKAMSGNDDETKKARKQKLNIYANRQQPAPLKPELPKPAWQQDPQDTTFDTPETSDAFDTADSEPQQPQKQQAQQPKPSSSPTPTDWADRQLQDFRDKQKQMQAYKENYLDQPAYPEMGTLSMSNQQLEDEMQKSASDLSAKYLNPIVKKAIDEAEQKGHEAFRAAYQAPSSMFGDIGKTALAAQREAQAADPEKVLKSLQGQVESLIQNPQFQEEMRQRARQFGIPDEDFGVFVTNTVRGELEQRMDDEYVQRALPKGAADYIMRGINDGILGTVYAATLPERTRQYSREAEAITAEGNNPHFNPNDGLGGKAAQLARTGVTFLSDAPFFGIYGKAGAVVAKPVVEQATKQMMRRYISRGFSEQAARRLVQTRLTNSFGGRVAQNLMAGIPAGAVNMGLYDATADAANQLYEGQGFDLAQTVEKAAVGTLKGAALSLTGAPFKAAAPGAKGIAKIAKKGAGFATEATTFATLTAAEQMANGELDAADLTLQEAGKRVAESAEQLAVMKLASTHGLQAAANTVRHPIQTIRSLWKPDPANPLAFTKEEKEQLKASRGAASFIEALQSFAPEQKETAKSITRDKENTPKPQTPEEQKQRQQEHEQQQAADDEAVTETFRKFAETDDVSLPVKQKVAAALNIKPDVMRTTGYTATSTDNPDGSQAFTIEYKNRHGDTIDRQTFQSAEEWEQAKLQADNDAALNDIRNINETEEGKEAVRDAGRELLADGKATAAELTDIFNKGTTGDSQRDSQIIADLHEATTRHAFPKEMPNTERAREEGLQANDEQLHQLQTDADNAEAVIGITLPEDEAAQLRQRVVEAEDPEKTIAQLADIYGDDVITSVIEYYNAKARLDGAHESATRRTERKVEKAQQLVQRNTADDGTVTLLRTRDGREAYRLAGELAVADDGTIDIENSAATIILRDTATGEFRMVPAADIAEAARPRPAEEVSEALAQQVRTAAEQAETDKFRLNPNTPEQPIPDDTFTDRQGNQWKVLMMPDETGTLIYVKQDTRTGEMQRLDPEEYRTAKSEELDKAEREQQPTIDHEQQPTTDTEQPAEPTSALDRIPEREDPATGKVSKDWEAAEPETTHKALVEKTGDPETAQRLIDAQIEKIDSDIKALDKQEIQSGDINDMLAARDANEARRKALTDRRDYWLQVKAQQAQKTEPKEQDKEEKETSEKSQEPQPSNPIQPTEPNKPIPPAEPVKETTHQKVVGRSLSEGETDNVVKEMEAQAEEMPVVEFTPENWDREFPNGRVKTPMGEVKMGENQLAKLFMKGRTGYLGMIRPTLEHPDVVIEKQAEQEGAERNTKYLFVKTFNKPDGGRIVHFESVTVKKDGMEVSVSSHEVEGKAIKKEMQNGKILHLSEKLSLGSDRYLTEAADKERPDLVPTSDNSYPKEVYARPALEPETATDSSEVNRGHSEGATATSRNSSITSADKDTNISATNKENPENLVNPVSNKETQTTYDQIAARHRQQYETEQQQRHSRIARAKAADRQDVAVREYQKAGAPLDDLDVPMTPEEYISTLLGPHSLNFEGKEVDGVKLNGVKQELGYDKRNAFGKDGDTKPIDRFLAKKGEGQTFDAFIHSAWESQPTVDGNMRWDTQELRNALLNLLSSARKPSDITNYILNNRIRAAEEYLKAEADHNADLEYEYTMHPEQREQYEPIDDYDLPFHKAADKPTKLTTAQQTLRNVLHRIMRRKNGMSILASTKKGQRRLEELRQQERTGISEKRETQQANTAFNEQLQHLVNGGDGSRRMKLGRAGSILRSSGITDAEIYLDYDKVLRKGNKGYKNDHPFDAEDLKDLPEHINDPLAVFKSAQNPNDHVILTTMEKDGKNFIVVIRTQQVNRKGGVALEVNEITTLYPKNAKGIVQWINSGLGRYFNKEKAQRWLGHSLTHQGSPANEELISAAKILENFENPKIPEENFNREQQTRLYIGKKKRTEYEARLKKAGYSDDEIATQLDFLHTLEQGKQNDKAIKTAVDWLAKRGIQDATDKLDDIQKAIKVAELAGDDITRYRSPQEVFDAHPDKVEQIDERQRINPDHVPQLTNRKEMEHGVVVYDVEDTPAGQQAMREILNTHFGKDANPWCLLQGDGKGNLSSEAATYWKHYSAYPKRVAFKDGKLLAFSANNSDRVQWWDRTDAPHDTVYQAGTQKTVETRPDGTRIERETTLDGTTMRKREYAADGTSWETEYEDNQNDRSHVLAYEREYDANGRLTRETEYGSEYGREMGHRTETEYYANGNTKSEVEYGVEGLEVSSREYYENGRMMGEYHYNARGDLSRERQYYENGNPKSDIRYDEEGDLKSERHYSEDGNTMYYTGYHDNGQISIESTYENDRLKSERLYDEDGNLIQDERYFRADDGEVYGYVDYASETIYIDPQHATAETLVHEFGHPWCAMLRLKEPDNWRKLVAAVQRQLKDTPLWKEVVEKYPELKGDDLAEELFCFYSGREGNAKLEAAMQEAMQKPSITERAAAIAAVEKVRSALRNFWQHVMRMVGVSPREMSVDDFANRHLQDILEGLNPFKEIREAKTDVVKYRKSMLDSLNKAAGIIRNSLKNGGKNKRFLVELPTPTLKKIKYAIRGLKENGRQVEIGQHFISVGEIRHARANHGVDGKKIDGKSIPLRDADLELAPYILAAPDYVESVGRGNGEMSLRFVKRLSNGVVVYVEKEVTNSPHDMQTANMWADLSTVTNARRFSVPGLTSKNVLDSMSGAPAISKSDAAKIRKDAETLIKNEKNLPENLQDSLKSLRESKQEERNTAEVTKIEVLDEKTSSTPNGVGHQSQKNSNVPLAKLLQNVEKSYDKGKKLLHESKNTDKQDNNLPDFRAKQATNDPFQHAKQIADKEREAHNNPSEPNKPSEPNQPSKRTKENPVQNHPFDTTPRQLDLFAEAERIANQEKARHEAKANEKKEGETNPDADKPRARKLADFGIKKGETFGIRKAREMFQTMNGDTELAALGKKLFDFIEEKIGNDITFSVETFSKKFGKDAARKSGHWDNQQHHVSLNSYIYSNADVSDQWRAKNILHEMIHSVTSYAIEGVNSGKITQRGLVEAVNELRDIYNELKADYQYRGNADFSPYRTYGMKNESEMIAEVANPRFRALLKAKNLWTRFVDTVKRIVGCAITGGKQTTALKELETTLGKFLDNFDKQEYMGENDPFIDNVMARLKASGKTMFDGGDKAERIAKLRDSEPAKIEGDEIERSEDFNQYRKNAIEYGKTLRKEYTNLDTGAKIMLTSGKKNGGLYEILQHDYKNEAHLQSVAAIPQIIEKSIYIDSRPNEDTLKHPNITSYDYYVCGLKINGEDYTVKAVVANMKDGNRYYDHKLTEVEKGKLIDEIRKTSSSSVSISSQTPESDVFGYKDKRLLSILQENDEKKLDGSKKTDKQDNNIPDFRAKQATNDPFQNAKQIADKEREAHNEPSEPNKPSEPNQPSKRNKQNPENPVRSALPLGPSKNPVQKHTDIDRQAREITDTLADRSGLKVTIIHSPEEITDPALRKVVIEQGKKAWHYPGQKEVFIYAPHVESRKDLEQSILHESVGHYGLESLLGKTGFGKLMQRIATLADKNTRQHIQQMMRDNKWTQEKAAAEACAELAEDGISNPSLLRRACYEVRQALRAIGFNTKITDNEIKYYLWKARNAMQKGVFAQAKDTHLRQKLGIDKDQNINFKDKGSNVRLSKEKDEKGHPFVISSDGTTSFGNIKSNTGLTAAPIKLSEGVITDPITNAGYGLVHIEARHGDEIRKAGYKSVVDFVNDVATNYEKIKEGKLRNGTQTYLLQLKDKYNNTLVVELSKGGNYWNVNTAGIFKQSYAKNNKEVYTRQASSKQPATTAKGALPANNQGGISTETSPDTAPKLPERKDSSIPSAAKVRQISQNTKQNPENLVNPVQNQEAQGLPDFRSSSPKEDEIRKKWADKYQRDLDNWKLRNGIKPDAQKPALADGWDRMMPGEDRAAFMKRYIEGKRQQFLWQTAPIEDNYQRMAEREIDGKLAIQSAQRLPLSVGERLKAASASMAQLREAVRQQRESDKSSVRAVVDFIKDFLHQGFGDGLGRGEVMRLLSTVRAAAGNKNIDPQIQNALNILIDHHTRELEKYVQKQFSVRTAKVNNAGVQVQAGIDLRAQTTMRTLRNAIDIDMTHEELASRIAAAQEALMTGSTDAMAKYDGLMLAAQWKSSVEADRKELSDLREEREQAIAEYRHSGRTYQEQQALLKSIDRAMLDSKLQQIASLGNFITSLNETLAGGMTRAKEFNERERQRVEDIQHDAMIDLFGKQDGAFRDETTQTRWGEFKRRAANNDFLQFFLQPLATFEQMLKQFGATHAFGEGRLYNRFINQFIDAKQDVQLRQEQSRDEMNKKAAEVFDKKGMKWADLYTIVRKLPSMKAEIIDGQKRKTITLSQGNMLYIVMANRMEDGKMKLRKMGISEDDVANMQNHIDPRLLTLGDWLQYEYLPEKRAAYNEIHEQLFGAPMAEVPNYFPLKINKESLYQSVDVGVPDRDDALPSAVVGSIIKRTKNTAALDITNADAFDVAVEHMEQMDTWAGMARFKKDVSTLLSCKPFRNKVKQMTTIYGSGEQLWNRFRDVARIATGDYRSKATTGSVDKLMSNVAKGVTAAKINFRLWTAGKQILSAPAFWHDCNVKDYVENAVKPWEAWNWCMKNLPLMRKRWMSRQIGDTRLMKDATDWKVWHSHLTETCTRLGMTPNAFIDAVTCCVGAKALYQTTKRRLLKYGYTEEQAEKKAMREAEKSYNLTQQSSEGAFVSAIQSDRTVAANALSVFRNSSFSYTRQTFDALRNLKHKMNTPKEDIIRDTARLLTEQDGLDPQAARRAAEGEYNRTTWHEMAKALNMMFGVTFAWNLGGNLWYLMLGDDNEKKKQMMTDAALKALIGGPVEGLTGGSLMSDMAGSTFTSQGVEWKGIGNVNFSLLPLLSDMQNMAKHFSSDTVAGIQDVVNIAAQASTGVNPQTATDIVNAAIDFSRGDMQTAREIALLIMRVLEVPAASTDNFYIDELGLSAAQAQRMTFDQLAERYAQYKLGKNVPIGGWLIYGDDTRAKKLKSGESQFARKVKERYSLLPDDELLDRYLSTQSQKESNIINAIQEDRQAATPAW